MRLFDKRLVKKSRELRALFETICKMRAKKNRHEEDMKDSPINEEGDLAVDYAHLISLIPNFTAEQFLQPESVGPRLNHSCLNKSLDTFSNFLENHGDKLA